jgi:hypothetical protein
MTQIHPFLERSCLGLATIELEDPVRERGDGGACVLHDPLGLDGGL